MVLYWRYRDEESHYLQVGFTVYYIVYRGQQRLWSSTGDTGRRNPTTYRYSRVHCVHCVQSSAEAMVLYWRYREKESHYLQVGFNVYIVYRVQQRLWSSSVETERRSPTTYR